MHPPQATIGGEPAGFETDRVGPIRNVFRCRCPVDAVGGFPPITECRHDHYLISDRSPSLIVWDL
jgi:hypothetical protein